MIKKTRFYSKKKRIAVKWLQKEGVEVPARVSSVEVVNELSKILKLSFRGEMDSQFAAQIIDSLFYAGPNPNARRKNADAAPAQAAGNKGESNDERGTDQGIAGATGRR